MNRSNSIWKINSQQKGYLHIDKDYFNHILMQCKTLTYIKLTKPMQLVLERRKEKWIQLVGISSWNLTSTSYWTEFGSFEQIMFQQMYLICIFLNIQNKGVEWFYIFWNPFYLKFLFFFSSTLADFHTLQVQNKSS